MADVVLRFRGPSLTRADAVSLGPQLHILRFWDGSSPQPRRTSKQPGFNLQIAENEAEPTAAIAEAKAFLEAKLTDLVALSERGACGVLDVGVYVDANGSGMKSTRLDPEFLELLARARLTLCVTSYICDDDDDETSEEDWATAQRPPG